MKEIVIVKKCIAVVTVVGMIVGAEVVGLVMLAKNV